MITNYIEIIAFTAVVSGVYLISKPRIEGHYIMIVAQILWLTLALTSNLSYLAFQSLTLLVLEVRAIYNWKQKNIGIN